MAQAVDRPKDDGKVRLPRTDAAMLKVAPKAPAGGKGSEDDKSPITMQAGEEHEDEKDDEILATARKEFERCIAAESENRRNALDDLKFLSSEGQWPADVVAQRNFDQRPCVTVDKLLSFFNQVANDHRQNRPQINASPVGDRADKEVAKMLSGLIRFCDRDSSADLAYDKGFDSSVAIGWGYWRNITEYEDHKTFNQTIRIKRIPNTFSVYIDPDSTDPDGGDSTFGFITEELPHEEFKALYPEADPINWQQGGIGEQYKNWVKKETVRVAEYFKLSFTKKTLVELVNGWVGYWEDLDEEGRKIEVNQERETQVPQWKWYKITAVEVLDRRDWIGSHFPIVKVIGNEINIEGKIKYSGLIRRAKGAQLMYNYFRTLALELAALQPKAPYIGAMGQFEGMETQWKQANTKSYPYLEYNPVDVEGKPAPPPQRNVMQAVTTTADQQAQIAAMDMTATVGIQPSGMTPRDRTYDESGRALRELRRAGDLGSFHFTDNHAISLRRQGEIYIDLIPKVFDTKRVVTILREDGTEQQVLLDPKAPQPFAKGQHPVTNKPMDMFNPNIGRYGVTVTIGPSYATKRIEAAESMMDFARALPNAAALIMDLIAKNQDWPGADEMATRLARAVPPQLLAPDAKDIPPQVQAVLHSMDGQIKQLMQERLAMQKALNDQNADRQLTARKIEADFEAKLMKIIADLETKMGALNQKREDSTKKNVGDKIQQLADEVIELRNALTQQSETMANV